MLQCMQQYNACSSTTMQYIAHVKGTQRMHQVTCSRVARCPSHLCAAF